MTPTFERLGALDRFFLSCESDNTPMHIGAVCIFEGGPEGSWPLSVSRLRRHVASRLDALPRYRQRVRQVPLEGHPVWIDDEDFRIENHIRAVALPAPRSTTRFEETVSWIFAQPLCRTRPLWEIWLIEGLEDGAVALACKVHHCVADGLGAASLLAAVLGTEPFAEPGAAAPWSPRPGPSNVELITDAVASRVRTAADLAGRTGARLLASPGEIVAQTARVGSAVRALAEVAWRPPLRTPFHGEPGSGRGFLWWSASLEAVKSIGRSLGGTVNDVALALVSDAFAQTSAGLPRDASLRVFCPVGATGSAPAAGLGNRVSGMFVELPVGQRTLGSRWRAVLAATARCKNSGAAQGAFLLEEFANALAPSLLGTLERTLGGAAAYNLIVTNVPGPRIPLYLFGQKMKAAFPLVPLFRGQTLGIAIFSYENKLLWGFNVDASHMDAARQLRHALGVALERLSLLADVPLAAELLRANPARPESKPGLRGSAAAREPREHRPIKNAGQRSAA